VCGLVDIPR